MCSAREDQNASEGVKNQTCDARHDECGAQNHWNENEKESPKESVYANNPDWTRTDLTVEPISDSEEEKEEEEPRVTERAAENNVDLKEKVYKPYVPCPRRLKKEKDKAEFEKFWNLLKTVVIPVPFTDLINVCGYTKMIKEAVT